MFAQAQAPPDVELEVSRDRNATFSPQIVRKGQTRLDGFNDRTIALYARGLTTRDIRAHLCEMYDVDVSPDLISRVTDAVLEELQEWQSRPLDGVYPVVFIDALMVKIRDGVVANQPVYLAIGIDCDGAKQVLGLWVGPTTGESGKFWLTVLSELKSRGVADVCIVCCDGLTGLPDAINVIWPATTVQLCVVHLIRASLRYASKRDWTPLTNDLRLIYTAVDDTAAEAALDAFAETWSIRYPTIVNLWRTHCTEFVPFLAFPPEVRRVIYTTNLIEPMNARLRKVTRNRGQFPSGQAALKVLYLAVRNLDEFSRADCRHKKLGLETGTTSVHDLLRGTHPHTMTATITYTDGLTLPGPQMMRDTRGSPVGMCGAFGQRESTSCAAGCRGEPRCSTVRYRSP